MAAKGTRLEGGALTDEALDSSRTVLRQYGQQYAKGLQQYYTPPQVAAFIGRCLGAPRGTVLDLTAGDGALLAPWPAAQRYGVELDSDQIANGSYRAVHGDVQQVYPLLKLAGIKFDTVVLNPPFGLDWTDAARRRANSTLLTLRWGLDMLEPYSRGAMICGRDRYFREISDKPEAAGVYALVEVPDLFPGVVLPCVIAFFATSPALTGSRIAPEQMTAGRDVLDSDVEAFVTAAQTSAGLGYIRALPYTARDYDQEWKAIAAEHDRRRTARQARRRASFDITVRNGRLSVHLSRFARVALQEQYRLYAVEGLHGQHLSYFALNARDWRKLMGDVENGLLTADPALLGKVEQVMEHARRMLVPNYPVRPQQRLGYLDDLDHIRCVRSDPEKGIKAGSTYAIGVESKEQTTRGTRIVTNRDGDPEPRDFVQRRKLLHITIRDESGQDFSGWLEFDEEPEQIEYLIEHFDIPDPGDLASRYPDEMQRMRELVRDIEADYGWGGPGPCPCCGHAYPRHEKGCQTWSFRPFQIEDIARLLFKGSGLLAWEQGLGKTLGLMTLAIGFSRLGAQQAALYVVPQDLIKQWKAEAEFFFGATFEVIESPAHAREVAQYVRDGGTGWFMTHMEGLSITGKRDESLNVPEGGRKGDAVDRPIVNPQDYYYLPYSWRDRAFKHAAMERRPTFELDGRRRLADYVTTEIACPGCGHVGSNGEGWLGDCCSVCGWVHKRVRVHTAGHWLATGFRRGAIFVDEITNAAGDSLRADAVCGLHSDHRIGSTGTPIKNYVNDSFKILWWCLGNASYRFPYDYIDGRSKFENDFCVIETLFGPERKDGSRTSRRKVLPRVTNLSMLWRLLCGAMIRRRKEDTGETIVPIAFHPVWTPAGVAQQAMNRMWVGSFVEFFSEKYPDHKLVQAGLVGKFEAALGLLWKMEYASTLPAADPDLPWLIERAPRDDDTREKLEQVSNWTPANLKALELVVEHARAGEKVVVFSDLIETGRWASQQLRDRGIRAAHIVEDRDGKAATKNPRARADAIDDFRFGTTQVLCVGIKAVKQGHNLDTASVAVFMGQEWSHEARSQAMARVHRLSSTRPVNIYIPMPHGQFMAAKKYELLSAKGASSDLALDGQLIEQDEREISWQEVLEQMKDEGFRAAGDEIAEASVELQWQLAIDADEHRLIPLPGQLLLPMTDAAVELAA